MADAIVFPAQVVKVQTLADGGLRLTLDMPETAILEAAHLMECKRQGVPGEVSYRPMVGSDKQVAAGGKTRNVATRSEWKPQRETAEEPGAN